MKTIAAHISLTATGLAAIVLGANREIFELILFGYVVIAISYGMAYFKFNKDQNNNE